jgi:O-antigen/teichoic acid export membrane protein
LNRLFKTSTFANNVSILVGGAGIGQGIIIIASPVLTRLYAPEDFGVLAVYSSLLGILSVISSLRYQVAIPLPNSDQDALNLVALCSMIVSIIAILVLIIIIPFSDDISKFLNTPQLSNYLWLLPIGLFLSGIYQVVYYWAVRGKYFIKIAKTRINQSVTLIIIQLLGFQFGSLALILGQTFGQGMGSVYLAKEFISHTKLKQIKLIDLKRTLIQYRRFPLLSSWASLLNACALQFPYLIFAFLFGANTAGIYALAHRVLSLPMSMVGTAVGNVFFSNAIEANLQNRLDIVVREVFQKLSQIAMPPLIVLIIAGPEIFTIVFGSQWYQAGNFARWMAPWIYIAFVTSPLSHTLIILESQGIELFFQLFLFITRICSIVIGFFFYNITMTIAFISISSFICYFILLLWILFASKNKLRVILSTTLVALGWSLLCVSPLVLVKFFSAQIWTLLGLFITTVLLFIRYYFLIKSQKLGPN